MTKVHVWFIKTDIAENNILDNAWSLKLGQKILGILHTAQTSIVMQWAVRMCPEYHMRQSHTCMQDSNQNSTNQPEKKLSVSLFNQKQGIFF